MEGFLWIIQETLRHLKYKMNVEYPGDRLKFEMCSLAAAVTIAVEMINREAKIK